MNAEVVPRVTVRPAEPADAHAIRGLEGLSASSARLLDHDLSASDRCCLVADAEVERSAPGSSDAEVARSVTGSADAEVARGARVVGYAAAIVQLGEAQVIDLVVTPQRRGERVGSQLLDGLLVAVADRGAGAVTLEVSVDNSAAQALYRRRGFVVEGRRPGYYADGSDALIMWRRPDAAGASAPEREER